MPGMEAMTTSEQAAFEAFYSDVEKARSVLEDANAGSPERDEDLRVACSRLDNWLLENYGRWVK